MNTNFRRCLASILFLLISVVCIAQTGGNEPPPPVPPPPGLPIDGALPLAILVAAYYGIRKKLK